jgi:hypothetical protein
MLQFCRTSIPAAQSTQPAMQQIPGIHLLEVKYLGFEVDHSPLSHARVNRRSYATIPLVRLWHAQGQFYCYCMNSSYGRLSFMAF